MNDERPPEAVGVLALSVRMIPIRPGLFNLCAVSDGLSNDCLKMSYSEIVGKGGPRRDRALGDIGRAVHVTGTVHEQAMEMQRR